MRAEMIAGLRRCSVCNKDFQMDIRSHYVSRDNKTTGLNTIMSNVEVSVYDTFDCPHCGCQNVIQERKRVEEKNNEIVQLSLFDDDVMEVEE